MLYITYVALKYKHLPLAAIWSRQSANLPRAAFRRICWLFRQDQTSPHKSLNMQPNYGEGCYSEKFVFMPSVVVWLGGRTVPLSLKSAEPGSNKPQYLAAVMWLADTGRFNLPTAPSLFMLQLRCFSLSPQKVLIRNKCLAFVPFSWSRKPLPTAERFVNLVTPKSHR